MRIISTFLVLLVTPSLTSAAADDLPSIAEYWNTRSVVLAEVTRTSFTGGNSVQYTFTLKPKLTLSGRFDPGKLGEFAATYVSAKPDEISKLSSVGPEVLVLILRRGDSYVVCPENAQFMPGNHLPICTVSGLEDARVVSTIEEIAKVRHTCD